MVESARELLLGLGLPEIGVETILALALVTAVLVLSWAANLIARAVLLRVVWHVISRTSTDWDDAFVKRDVFRRFANLAPAVVIYLFAPAFGTFESWVARLALVYMIALSIRVVESVLDAGSDIYESHERARAAPIAGYIQVGKIALYIVGAIFVIATGLGAMSAVLLLVFRDSILGLVASVQLSSYNMVHLGNWIEMPAYGADGEVIDVSLHTVKVQNWDKTISTIPTQSLISQSFKNWRGMEESGGRRIKRALNIDMSTIEFCDAELLERFESFEYLKSHLATKRKEIEEYNRASGADTAQLINGRRLTNVGTFRAYVEEYLRRHPKIHQEMTFLVRQLAPTEKGLPLEIYVFSNDQV